MTLLSSTFEIDARPSAPAVSASVVDTLVIATAAAAFSLVFTGFVFGIENNLFHLPIVAGLYDEPQYRDDAFIQSLRYFASGVWVMLSGIQKHIQRVDLLFLGLDCLSRLLSFVGLLCCAELLGVVSRREKIVFAVLACTTPFLIGFSSAGTGGLLVGYFTHSEMANGTLLLGIYFAMRGQFAAATVALGVTFFINALMAVWLAPLLVIIGICHLVRGQTTLLALCSRVLVGALIAAPIVYPAVHNVISNPEFGKPIGFDYIAYLREYFPGHSLIDAIPLADVAAIFAVMLLGAAAVWRLGERAGDFRAVYIGAVGLYLLGCVLPLVSGSPLLLNLQLLRAGVVTHLLASIATLALATHCLCRDRSLFLPGCLIVLSLAFGRFTFLLATPIILLFPYFQSASEAVLGRQRRLGFAALAVVALVLTPMWGWQYIQFNRFYSAGVEEWGVVSDWARRETPETAIFIVPPRPDPRLVHPVWKTALSRAVNFEFISHRRIWVDWRRGAGAMWTPSYYRVWHERMNDLENLESHAAKQAYAARNGIGYIVSYCETLPSQDDVVFRTEYLCVSGVRRATAALLSDPGN